MITLWVMEDGLASTHDPDNPALTDIRKTIVLAAKASRVILQTANGKFLRKDPSVPDGTWEGEPLDFSAPDDMRVIFDPVFGTKVLECKARSPGKQDLENFSEMVTAVKGY